MPISQTNLYIDSALDQVVLDQNNIKWSLPWIPVENGKLKVKLIVGTALTSAEGITIRGTSGSDLIVSGTWQAERIDAGAGDDTILFHDGGLSYFQGQSNVAIDAVLLGGAGNDRISSSEWGETLDGGTGFDWLLYNWSLAAVSVDLASSRTSGGSATKDTIRNFEAVGGSVYDDRLYGNEEANELRGMTGNDLLSGRAGNDTLIGDKGNDTLSGSDGSDRLLPGSGRDSVDAGSGDDTVIGAADGDTLSGSSGTDLVSYVYLGAGVRIDLAAGSAQTTGGKKDALGGFENAQGSGHQDTITGAANNNLLLGLAGNDSILGGDGKDTLRGDAGVDTLNGGAGSDLLLGGDGNDRFVFSRGSVAERDTI